MFLLKTLIVIFQTLLRFVRIISLLAVVILSYFMYNYKWIFNVSLSEREKEISLVVAVLSAQENFEQRQALRATWLNKTEALISLNGKSNFNFKSWFIVGKEFCQIPPSFRLSNYDCTPWYVNVSGLTENFFTGYEIKSECLAETTKIFHQGFSFKVQHPVVVEKIGIYQKLLLQDSNVTVALLDVQSKSIVVQASISTRQFDLSENGFLYVKVENFLLPKGYEGLVLTNGPLFHSSCRNVQWYNGSGIIKFDRIYGTDNHFESIEFANDLQVAPSIGFFVPNINSLRQKFFQKERETAIWSGYVQELSKELEKENKQWKDIVFVDVIDTYRSLPVKLLKFYNWLVTNEKFSFVLKTDDDCVVNLSKIIANLNMHLSKHMWVWSRFRYQWPINYVGKWADHEYKSPVYPAFPCGGGYVLSYRIVEWLSSNSAYLHSYQGEDVSLGIWLAAVNPIFSEDLYWTCNEKCTENCYNRVQLNIDQIYEAWSLHKRCGNLCHCEN